MTSIERTVYRRMKRSYATKELIEAYTPTDEERRFVNTMTRAAQNQLNLMLWIKRFPCLGYFPSLDEIPTPLVTHLRQALDLAANAIPGYTGFPYVLFCAYLGFRSSSDRVSLAID